MVLRQGIAHLISFLKTYLNIIASVLVLNSPFRDAHFILTVHNNMST